MTKSRMTPSRRHFAQAAAAGLVLLAAAPLAAQTSGETAVAAAVEELHQAIIAADAAKLAAVSAETLTYGHSAGRLENKAQFIDQLVSGRSVYRSIVVQDQKVIISGDVATVRHNLAVVTVSNGKDVPSRLGVLLVWQKQPDRWRLIARQSIGLPS
jgi:ketosteroid isomerase-like protein